ncbi:hypothetical protein [Streptomyces phytophilus]|uniref:hypothetical protein n=1 Tax=Streptomyces phytophilus TaxID=722715 RepID=UPI0015F0148D|nr:hypothetical protein [Streptomyces phytophilus]
MCLKRGGSERACATCHRALDHMDGVRSNRIGNAVTGMRNDLTAYGPAACDA